MPLSEIQHGKQRILKFRHPEFLGVSFKKRTISTLHFHQVFMMLSLWALVLVLSEILPTAGNPFSPPKSCSAVWKGLGEDSLFSTVKTKTKLFTASSEKDVRWAYVLSRWASGQMKENE